MTFQWWKNIQKAGHYLAISACLHEGIARDRDGREDRCHGQESEPARVGKERHGAAKKKTFPEAD